MVLIFLDFGVLKCSSTLPKNNNREHKEQQWLANNGFPFTWAIFGPLSNIENNLRNITMYLCIRPF